MKTMCRIRRFDAGLLAAASGSAFPTSPRSVKPRLAVWHIHEVDGRAAGKTGTFWDMHP